MRFISDLNIDSFAIKITIILPAFLPHILELLFSNP